MKRNLFRLLSLFITLLIVSCAKDDPFEENATFETTDLSATIGRSTTPCAKNLASMVSGASLNIGCVSDLSGKTINLPKGADIKYDGGTILNGTLHFDGGTIDGRLLNKDLKITGTVKLANSTYTLEADQWALKQGNVGEGTALENLQNINSAIEQVKRLGGDTFKIGKFDAYFGVGNHDNDPSWISAKDGILIPDFFTLQMSDDTHLRVYPNAFRRYALVGLMDSFHSRVIGGNLHGDRDKHHYKSDDTDEWGILLEVQASQWCSITGVTLENATGDGMTIQAHNPLGHHKYKKSEHIMVNYCTFKKSRRNGLSIADVYSAVVQNSTFIDNGVDTKYSKGTNPRFAIDVEPNWFWENGKIVEWQQVDRVIIRNNVEKGSARGGFTVSSGSNVTIENNKMENSLSYRYAKNTIVKNNTIKATKKNGGAAIRGGIDDKRAYNNKIYDNTINGFEMGIVLYGQDNEVYNNTIKDCDASVFIRDLRDSKIYDNTMSSKNHFSQGIFGFAGTMDGVEFNNNDIDVDGEPFYFRWINEESSQRNFHINVKNNTFRSKNRYAKLERAHGITFENNKIYTSIWNQESENIKYLRNTIDGSSSNLHTVYFRGGNKKVELGHNKLRAKKGNQNTYNKPAQNPREIKEYGNSFSYR